MLLHDHFRRTCFVHTHRPRTVWWTSNKANKFSYATLHVVWKNCTTKLHKFIFACHNLVCKPPWNARMHMTLSHLQTVLNQPRTNWIRIKWQTWSQLECMVSATRNGKVHNYTHLYFLPELEKTPNAQPLEGQPHTNAIYVPDHEVRYYSACRIWRLMQHW